MVSVTEGFAPGVNAPRFGVNAPNFCVSFLLRWLFSLKCRRKSRENPYQNHPTKNENVTKRALLSSKGYDYFFFQFLPWGSCFTSVQLGRLDLMDIPKPMIKCCRWCCRINIIVLIWVSVVFLFHKCLRLFVLVCTPFLCFVLTMMLLSSLMFVILVF